MRDHSLLKKRRPANRHPAGAPPGEGQDATSPDPSFPFTASRPPRGRATAHQKVASGKNLWSSIIMPAVPIIMMAKKLTLRDNQAWIPSVSTCGVMMETSFEAPVLNSKAPVDSWSLSAVAGVATKMSSFALSAVRPRNEVLGAATRGATKSQEAARRESSAAAARIIEGRMRAMAEGGGCTRQLRRPVGGELGSAPGRWQTPWAKMA
eukprot:CAMPEP_0113819498 /NCGR_PEP_ID=MMETSP0328-20130328/769_1 /TAXON_ID=39455 /ORGANISM="Alexandrium minutum" /LENGTH=207 /DNA_ID=CAMNT_0000787431 /DNA_START=33 /DNA_END=656 /DNA_ORIENTATION=+ /assembly_acc=CAM_ASM_000350